jgi:hypothetical protein
MEQSEIPAAAARQGWESPPAAKRKKNWGKFSRVFWWARWTQLNTCKLQINFFAVLHALARNQTFLGRQIFLTVHQLLALQ